MGFAVVSLVVILVLCWYILVLLAIGVLAFAVWRGVLWWRRTPPVAVAPIAEPWPELAGEPEPKPVSAPPAPSYIPRWDGTRKWMAGEAMHDWDGLFEETLKASPRLSFMVSPDGEVTPPGRGSTWE